MIDRKKKRERRLRWRLLHPEQWREEKRRWYRKYYAKRQQARGIEVKPYKRKVTGTINLEPRALKQYGITQEEFDTLYEEQIGMCAICHTALKKPWSDAQKKLPHVVAIDHNHITNTVRGLLCRQCNLGLGNFKDDLWRLKNAITYLENAQRLERMKAE